MIQSRKIRYFLAAAEHLHFSAAASELCISQPALSRSMRQLEEQIGAPLFERAAKGVVLTRYGEILARRARMLEREAELTLAEIEAVRMGSGGAMHIGAGPVWMSAFLPDAVSALQNRHPNLQVDLVTGVLANHLTSLLDGKLDIVCGDLDFPKHPELTVMHLADLEFIVIAGKNHPYARRSKVTAEDLLKYPWIANRGAAVGRDRFTSFFAARDLSTPDPNILISPGVEVFSFLLEADYLAYIPIHKLPMAISNDCVRVDLAAELWRSPHGVVYRATKSPDAGISTLVSILKNQFDTHKLRSVSG
ncbi:MAG: LysR family transcriptional regulator [Candidatus Rariloculaceae bacterium]